MEHILPPSARMLTFNSLVQSHINYCSLVWEACSKTKIESIFIAQKKAIRGIMPGWVNYFYNKGTCPTHTKSTFKELNVLTVHNVILKNIMIFMNKIHNHPQLLPTSVTQIISPDSPSPEHPTDYSSDWYLKYNFTPYNTSLFFKGPLLYTDLTTHYKELGNTNLNSYKRSLKTYLLELQSSGDPSEWQPYNFRLAYLPGLRNSNRIKKQLVTNYTE